MRRVLIVVSAVLVAAGAARAVHPPNRAALAVRSPGGELVASPVLRPLAASIRRHLSVDAALRARGWLATAGLVEIRRIVRERLHRDGHISIRLDAEFKVFSNSAANALTTIPVVYGGGSKIVSAHAFVIDDGRVRMPAADAIHDYATQWAQIAPMYTDNRVRLITLPDVSVGALVAYDIRETETSPDEPGQLTYIWDAASIPIVHKQVVLTVPKGRRLVFAYAPIHEHGASRIEKTEAVHHLLDATEYVFTWQRVPARRAEVDSPSQPPGFAASTFGTWRHVRRWYYALAMSRTAPNAAIRAEAARLTAGKTTREAKIHALFDFVAANFRYISLSFGIGRAQPHPAAEVLKNGYGDCKDKAGLLISLLRAEGIPAYFALLDADGRLQRRVPAVDGFDHAIVAVPRSTSALRGAQKSPYQFLDATIPEAPGTLLGDSGHWALVVRSAAATGPELVRIPRPTAAEQETVENDKIQVAANGDMHVTSVIRAAPATALLSRVTLHYAGAGKRLQVEKELARATASNTHLVSFQATPWAELDTPYTLRTVRRMLHDASLSTPPFSVPLWWHFWPTSLGKLKHRRRLPLDLTELIVPYRQTMELTLPRGFAPVLPSGTTLNRPFAGFKISYSYNSATRILTARAAIQWRQWELPAAKVKQYVAFQKAVYAAGADDITLVLAPSAAPGAIANALRSVRKDVAGGHNRRAVALAKAILAVAPTQPTVRDDLGAAYLAQHDYTDARAVLGDEVTRFPADGEVEGLLARTDFAGGHNRQALREASAQLKRTPFDAPLLGLHGRILDAMGRRLAALKAFARALQIAPDSVRWRYWLGREQVAAGQITVGFADFRQVAASGTATPGELTVMAKAALGASPVYPAGIEWARSALAQEDGALAGADPSQLTRPQVAAMRRLPAEIELYARLAARQKDWKAALGFGRAALALRPDRAKWATRMAHWEDAASGGTASLPYWALALQAPQSPDSAMAGLERAYQSIPGASATPVDVYLASHPKRSQVRWGGFRLATRPATTSGVLALVTGGKVRAIGGPLPDKLAQKLRAAAFPPLMLSGNPITYVLCLGYIQTAAPERQDGVLVIEPLPNGKDGPRYRP